MTLSPAPPILRRDEDLSYEISHLRALESEAIHVIREVAAELDRAVLLFSGGKDSAVLLHLARKAFHPGGLPFAVMQATAAGFFKVGERAPNFTLTSLGGDTVSLDAMKGKVVVLGLFHICDPCMMQGTNLQKVHEAMKDKKVKRKGDDA